MEITYINLFLWGFFIIDVRQILCQHNKWTAASTENEYPLASLENFNFRIQKRDSSLGKTCKPQQQGNIFRNMINCELRDAVIDVPMPNDTDVFQTFPSQVSLPRCSGNCVGNRAHICTATSTEKVNVQIMYIKGAVQLGKWKTLCLEIEMEKHTSCKCGCELDEESCNPKQEFSSHTCKCLCKNYEARRQCLRTTKPRKQWDPVKCLCHCHTSTFTECTTGYAFDYLHECKCVPESQLTASLSAGASTPLSAIIGILACVVVVLIIGLIVLFTRYRHLQSRAVA